jgi:hypothetical protein
MMLLRIFLLLLLAATLPAASTPPAGRPQMAEHLACEAAGRRVGAETVRIPWTRVRTVFDDVDVQYCVLRGDADAPLAFLRDADHVYISLVGRGQEAKEGTYSFVVRMADGRTIERGPAWVRAEPFGQRSCRVDLCEVFTDPGERVVAVEVRTEESTRARAGLLTAAVRP